MLIFAPAKLNLELKILDKRPDGYHNINSVMQAIDLFDVVMVEKSNHFTLTGSWVCHDNLIEKAHGLMEEQSGRKLPCRIQLIKSIPIASGLGGGSSDAAAAIVGMSRLFELGYTKQQLAGIGSKVGADVPFFIYGGRCRVTGIGDIVEPLDGIEKKTYLVARPHIRVSTANMYRGHDELGLDFTTLARGIQGVEYIYQHLNKVSGNARVSGSGPTVFAEFDTDDDALEVVNDIEAMGIFDGDIFICHPIAGGLCMPMTLPGVCPTTDNVLAIIP